MTSLHPFNKHQSNVLYCSSWLALLSGSYALWKEKIDIALCIYAVFITSILYWKQPSNTSWRQYLDMTVTKIVLLYELFRVYNAQYCLHCYALVAISAICYVSSCYLVKHRACWQSVGFHFFVHLLSNIANVLLCSGEIPSIQDNFKVFYPFGFFGLALFAFVGIMVAYYI